MPHEHTEPIRSGSIDYLPALFLAVAFLFLPSGTASSSLNALAIVFVSIVLEAIPFMLIGSLVGGFIEVFVSRERMTAIMPRSGWLTVCIAAGAGMIFPVCECAVVPVVRRMLGKGLPFSAAIAYLLGGPIVNPIVGASTALAYTLDWRIVILRLGLGYGLAIFTGMFMGRWFANSEAIRDAAATPVIPAHACGCHCHPPVDPHGAMGSSIATTILSPALPATNPMGCGCDQGHPISRDWVDNAGEAITHAMNDFLSVGHYLVIGAFIAALAQTYIDRSNFLSVASAPVLSVIVMMVLAILLNLCSEADAFIAASFRGLMPMSAQMAFLLIGPMFDLKLLLMYQSVFTRRAIFALASLILGSVLAVAIGLEVLNGMFQ